VDDQAITSADDKFPRARLRRSALGDKAVHPELMQEQLDADAEALRTQNYPEQVMSDNEPES